MLVIRQLKQTAMKKTGILRFGLRSCILTNPAAERRSVCSQGWSAAEPLVRKCREITVRV